MQISLDDVAMMLGQKDIEIFALQREIAELRKKLEQEKGKPEQ